MVSCPTYRGDRDGRDSRGLCIKKRLYDPQFREGAVRIATEAGKPIREVAADLGIPSGTGDAFGDSVILCPEEEAVIARALETRRREFTAVRCCARLAMQKLGTAQRPTLPGQRGAPCWPDGLVGSMVRGTPSDRGDQWGRVRRRPGRSGRTTSPL
jgi:hypothetical protein